MMVMDDRHGTRAWPLSIFVHHDPLPPELAK
jgi:hypothetical protein